MSSDRFLIVVHQKTSTPGRVGQLLADGFGGGKDVVSRIKIMHDSRIGSYGVMALILASLARVGLLMAAALNATGLTLVLLLALVYAAARFLPVLQLSIIPVSPHARLASLTGNGGVWLLISKRFQVLYLRQLPGKTPFVP